MDFLSNTLHFTLVFFGIFLLAAISALFTEKSGILNIAVNGFMIFGATLYCLFAWLFGAKNPFWEIPIFFLSAFLTGFFALIFYYMSARLRINHVIAGIAINALIPSIAILILITASSYDPNSISRVSINWKFLHDLNLYNFIGSEMDPYRYGRILSFRTILAIFLAFISWLLLEKTRWGLRFKAVGENPGVADSVGINIFRVKKQACFISGFLAALAGQIFVSAILQSVGNFQGSVSGLGFISLTLVIMGNWNPFRIVGISLFFSFVYAISQTIQYQPSTDIEKYSDLLLATPFIFTILFLVISTVKLKKGKRIFLPKLIIKNNNSNTPEFLGKHYKPSKKN